MDPNRNANHTLLERLVRSLWITPRPRARYPWIVPDRRRQPIEGVGSSVQVETPDSTTPEELTVFLDALRDGDGAGAERALMPHVYRELRAIATSCMRGQRADHTLQPTALVSEAYLKLFRRADAKWNDRKHFFALAAKAMRQLLIDHARARSSDKRGGGRSEVTLDVAIAEVAKIDFDLIELNDALIELAAIDPLQGRIVELRYFGGLTMQQIADIIDASLSTVEREWRAARAWLGVQLTGLDPS